ncbi:hypothetical protein B5E41_30160 [Rhizobium esperanzae]|uniref:Uncharacterized protein n=1 Tax=Rhizobium esperanzae TaxID=1967781 RepID=A0A246DKU0_9HYPH|nr:hypothetical protein [Rhizobium esperanzae]OWO89706.1 hypothetical protein B5E41_30160 [Rhizobium esperanzae]
MKIAALTLSAVSLLPAYGMAQERPAFVGSYSIDCGADRQCWLVIDMLKPDAYLAIWTVSSRADFSDMKCGIPLFLRDTQDSYLRAGLDGKAVDIERQPGGRVLVQGLPAARCGIDLTGSYDPVGD